MSFFVFCLSFFSHEDAIFSTAVPRIEVVLLTAFVLFVAVVPLHRREGALFDDLERLPRQKMSVTLRRNIVRRTTK